MKCFLIPTKCQFNSLFSFVFGKRDLCNPGWPQIHSVLEAGLELWFLLASTSHEIGVFNIFFSKLELYFIESVGLQ